MAAALVYLWTELTYDEAVYLQLARKITETGLPWRRVYEEFDEFRLFGNSPPLVLYVAAGSQVLFPGNEIPARIVQLLTFVAPTYFLVWWVGRACFGPWAGCASLIALAMTGSYVRDTPNVLLNIPLGLFALLSLVAFYYASIATSHRRWWVAALATAVPLGIWTKYQAVVIAAAIVLYVMAAVVRRGAAALQPLLLPLTATVLSGAVASLALLGFFWVFSDRDGMVSMLTVNAMRIDPTGMSGGQILAALLGTLSECERTLGGVPLLLGAAAIWLESRHRGLLMLLTGYVGGTILFNLALFRLPGAGSSYLDAAVPALALLVGPAVVRVVQRGASLPAMALLAVGTIFVHAYDSPSSGYEIPRPNGSRLAAAYIAANSAPADGVVADTVAIEFYTGRPVRAAPFTNPTVVLRSLAGTTDERIPFVIVSDGPVHRNLQAIRQQWSTLLSEHFELVPVHAPGLEVYRRRRSPSGLLSAEPIAGSRTPSALTLVRRSSIID